MNKKLLIGIIVVFVIAAAIFAGVLFPFLLPVWIYLVWMVWKKKTNIFHDQMEPNLAERRLKWLKIFLLVAVISFAMYLVIIFPLRIVLTEISNQPEEVEHAIFWPAYSSVGLFCIATLGGLYIFLEGRRKKT